MVISMNNPSEAKRSTASWLMELADGMQGEYVLSIFAALLGIACSLSMFSGCSEKFQRTVTSTKALNDTAITTRRCCTA